MGQNFISCDRGQVFLLPPGRIVGHYQQVDEAVALGLAEQDRDQCRSVNDHLADRQPGRPSGP
jgi:hypothetical protein